MFLILKKFFKYSRETQKKSRSKKHCIIFLKKIYIYKGKKKKKRW